MKPFSLLSLLPLLSLASSSSIVELAVATPQLSTLVSVLTLPDYEPILSALSGDGPFTVFAPSDEAFKAAGVDVTDVAAVTEVLKYHVVSGAVSAAVASDLTNKNVPTLQGQTLFIRPVGQSLMVNKARVVQADVVASNGVVHIINRVLFPKLSKPKKMKIIS